MDPSSPLSVRPRHRRLSLCFLIGTTLVSLSPHDSVAGVPDLTQSYFVPQTGAVATPTEGTLAIRLFRVCPNNDGGASLPNNARIKIVLRDGNGNPVPEIAAEDICILLNGGTSVQGFSGVGADSIIANRLYNTTAQCPDVRCIPADAPTDANGVTYITFAGATPGSPGVATRDPSRKWGHYDSELPVYAMGYKLSGRLTSASSNGSYILRIKNFDIVGGLDQNSDRGEIVDYSDFNLMAQTVYLGGSCHITYWEDLDGSGAITAVDYNILVTHYRHACDYPNNP